MESVRPERVGLVTTHNARSKDIMLLEKQEHLDLVDSRRRTCKGNVEATMPEIFDGAPGEGIGRHFWPNCSLNFCWSWGKAALAMESFVSQAGLLSQ